MRSATTAGILLRFFSSSVRFAQVILKTLFGYTSTPTVLRLEAYLCYWVVIALAYMNIDRLHKVI